MKKTLFKIAFLLIVFNFISYSIFGQKGLWYRKADFPGGGRNVGYGFSVNNLGYAGGGGTNTAIYKDIYEYNPTTDTWTRKSDLSGNGREGAASFNIGGKGYCGLGCNNTGVQYNDFWEYDPGTDTWAQKADFGSTARNNPAFFVIGTKVYIGTGKDAGGDRIDFWEYDQGSNSWTQIADFIGDGRSAPASFAIDTKGYVGTGWNETTFMKSDFYEYDQSSNTWSRKRDFGGSARFCDIGFAIGSKGYIGTGATTPGGENVTKDFWEYDPSKDTWTKVTDMDGTARSGEMYFLINDRLYVCGGWTPGGTLIYDVWQWCPDCGVTCSVVPLQVCPGNNITIYITIVSGTVFNANNVFTAQLSGPDGSFTSPKNIGTIKSSTDCSINYTIPVNQTTGTNYRVRVISTNPSLTSNDNGADITINPLPKPAISGPGIVCTNSNGSFSANLMGTVDNQWYTKYGKINGSSNAYSVLITYDNEYTDSLKLVQTILATGCRDSTYKVVYSTKPPIAKIMGDTICCGDLQTYSSLSHETSYKWTAIGGEIEGNDDRDQVIVKWKSGNRSIKLVLTNFSKCSDSTILNIQSVNPLPPKPFVIGDSLVCAKHSLVFMTNNIGGTTLLWNANGGRIDSSSSDSVVTVTWDSARKGSITCNRIDNVTGCKSTITKSITVYPFPSPKIIGTNSICTSGSAKYYTKSDSITANQWIAFDGAIIGNSTQDSIDIKWGSSAKGIVRLIQSTKGTVCTDSTELEVTINPNPPKPEIIGITDVCSNCNEIYSTIGKQGIDNLWSVSGGVLLTPDNRDTVQIQWGSKGTGSLQLIQANTITGCKDSTVKIINITDAPKPVISGSIGNIDEACESNIYAYSTSSNPDLKSQWYVINGEIFGDTSDRIVNIKWGTTGIGKIKLVQENTFKQTKDSTEIDITIYPLPTPSINGPATVPKGKQRPYRTDDIAGITNQWIVTGGTITGSSTGNQIMVFWDSTDNGTVKLTQTSSHGCIDSTSLNIIKDTTGLRILFAGIDTTSGKDYTNVCEQSTHSYKTKTVNGTTNKWYVTGGIINSPTNTDSINVTWGYAGTGEVKLVQTINDLNFEDSVSLKITINKLPQVTLNKFNDVCLHNPEFDLAGGSPLGGVYSGNGVNNGKFNSMSAGVGTFNISYSYTDNLGCTNTAGETITVLDIPPKPKITAINTTLVSSATEGNQWFLNDSIISGATDQFLTITVEGDYVVQVKGPNGCYSDMSDRYNYMKNRPQATLQIGRNDMEGKPGEIISIPIYLINTKLLDKSGASGFKADLKFNATLLMPTMGTSLGTRTSDERIIPLTLPLNPEEENILKFLNFQVTLGNDTSTRLVLQNLSAIGGEIKLDSIEGKFRLTGVCMEGGSPRLLNFSGTTQLLVIKPNPTDNQLEIEYETIEEGMISLYITDNFGNTVRVIRNRNEETGVKSLTYYIGDLASGIYYLNLKTQTTFKTKKLEIYK